MKDIHFKEYKIKVNDNNTATVHCALKDDCYLCLFNRESEKDFINAYKALGFSIAITVLGDKQQHFYPILYSNETKLTEEVMETIWMKINEEGLPT